MYESSSVADFSNTPWHLRSTVLQEIVYKVAVVEQPFGPAVVPRTTIELGVATVSDRAETISSQDERASPMSIPPSQHANSCTFAVVELLTFAAFHARPLTPFVILGPTMAFSSACSTSFFRSSASSIPQLNRTKSSKTPIASLCSRGMPA